MTAYERSTGATVLDRLQARALEARHYFTPAEAQRLAYYVAELEKHLSIQLGPALTQNAAQLRERAMRRWDADHPPQALAMHNFAGRVAR